MEINKPVSAIIIFIITLLIAFLFALPEYQKLNDLQNTLTIKQADYNGKFIYYAEISKLAKNIESKKSALEKIDDALPPDFSFAPLIYFFQKQGSEAGLKLKSISFAPISAAVAAVSNKEIKIITFTVELSGEYQGLKKLLYTIDTSARLFEVNAISFKASNRPSDILSKAKKKKNNQQTYDFHIEMKTHAY